MSDELDRDLHARAAYVRDVSRAVRRQELAAKGCTRDALYACVRARRAWLRMLAGRSV